MGYKYTLTTKIDLSDLGTDANDQPLFVEIKNPKLLTYGEKMSLATVAQQYTDPITNKMTFSPEAIAGMGKVAQGYISAWNLLDIATGTPVDCTAADAFDHVPGEVVEAIFNAIKNSAGTGDATKNS